MGARFNKHKIQLSDQEFNQIKKIINTSLQLFQIKNNVQTTLLYNKFADK